VLLAEDEDDALALPADEAPAAEAVVVAVPAGGADKLEV
jgi:hypothetical protein